MRDQELSLREKSPPILRIVSLSWLKTASAVIAILLAFSCSVTQAGLGPKVDVNPPSIAITTPVGASYVSGDITVNGTVADDVAVKSVTVTASSASGAGSYPATITGKTWAVTFHTGSAASPPLPDGTLTITATASGNSGKTSNQSVVVNLDNTPPTALVTVPQDYGAQKPSTSDYIEFKGEAWDGSPVTKVEVAILNSSGTTEIGRKTASGTNSWFVRFIYNTDIVLSNTVIYSYKVYVTDAAGNISSKYYHSADIWPFLAPTDLFPTTDAIGKADQNGTPITAIHPQVTQAMLQSKLIDGTAPHPLADFKVDTSTRKPQISLANLTVTNNANQNVLGAKPAISGFVYPGVATGAPNIDPTSISAAVTFEGSSTPLVGPNGDGSFPGTFNSPVFTIDLKTAGGVYPTNGYYTATITAKSTQNDVSTVVVHFMVNTLAPWVVTDGTNSTPLNTPPYLSPKNLAKVGGSGATNFTMNVPVNDGNDAKKVVVSAKAYVNKYNASHVLLTQTEITPANYPSIASTPVTSSQWLSKLGYDVVIPFTPDALPDGLTEIQADLTLTDDAGFNSFPSYIYNIRGSAPTVTISNPANGSWVSGSLISFSGTADTVNSTLVLTNLVPKGQAYPAFTDPSWKAANNVFFWSYAQDMASATETDYDFYAVSEDSDGTFGTPQKVTVYYDKTDPTLSSFSIPSSPSYANQLFTITGTAADTRALKSVSITQTKVGSGLPAVELLPGATNLSASSNVTSYPISIPNMPQGGLDGVYSYVVTVTDVAGKFTTQNYQVTFSRTPPQIIRNSISPLVGTNKINKIATLNYSVTDSFGINKIWYRWNGDPTDASANRDPNGIGTLTAVANPSALLSVVQDTRPAFPQGAAVLYVVAEDNPGNYTWYTENLVVDQTTDNPVITLNNLDPTATTSTLSDVVKNLLGTNPKVLATLTDDDDIDTSNVKILIDIDPASAIPSDWTSVSVTGSKQLGYAFQYALGSLSDGIHKFTIKTSDLASAKVPVSAVTTQLGPIYFALDRTPPALSISNVQGALKNGDFVLSGSSSSAVGITSIETSTNPGFSAPTTVSTSAGAWTWNIAVPGDHSLDGTHTYYVKATDTFGSNTVVSYQFTADTQPPTVAITNPPVAFSWLSGSTYNASGTADDGSGSGVTTVYYSTDNATWTAASGTNNWSATLNLAALGEGSLNVYVRAVDAAGNSNTSVIRNFGVDQANPGVTETTLGTANSSKKALFTLGGNSTDSNALASVRVTESKDGGAAVTVLNQTTGAVQSQGWTTGNMPSGGVADGSYLYTVTVTDIAGKTSSLTRTVNIDTTAPSVAISAPTAANTGVNSLFGTSYRIQGTSDDGTGTGVAKVYYWLGASGSSPPVSLGSWTSITTSGVWSDTIDLTVIGEGLKELFVKSEDNAGNVTAAASTVIFGIDQASPTVTETQLGAITSTKTAYTLGGSAGDTNGLAHVNVTESKNGGAATTVYDATLTGTSTTWTTPSLPGGGLTEGSYSYVVTITDIVGKTTTLNKTVVVDLTPPSVAFINPLDGSQVNKRFTLNGSVSDLNGMSAVKYWIGTGSAPALFTDPAWTVFPSVPYQISVDSTTLTDNTAYNLVIGAQDPAGNYASQTVTVNVNQSSDKPVITLTNLDPSVTTSGAAGNNLLESNPKIQATIIDDDAVDTTSPSVLLDKTPGSALPSDWVTGTVNGSGKNASFQYSMNAVAEGLHYFYMKTSDLASAKGGFSAVSTTIGPVYFVIDKTPPAVAISNTPNALLNSDFVIGGTASSANGISKVEVSTNSAFTSPTTVATSAGAWNWNVTVPGDHSLDGALTYYVRATDNYNKTTIQSYPFTIDTTPPNVAVTNPTVSLQWLTGSSTSANGTASDAGTGIGTVLVSTDGTNYTSANGTSNWSANINLAALSEGTNTLYVKAIDGAGNASAVVTRNFGIDQNLPTVTETGVGAAISSKSALFTLSGAVTDTNNLAGVTVTESKDGGAAVTVLNLPESGTSQSWTTANLPSGGVADGSYVYSITVSDVSGKTALLSRTITIDTTPPVVSITNPAAASWLLGSAYTISGNASDPGSGASGVKTIYYWVGTGSAPGSLAAWTSIASAGNWSATIDLTALGEGNKNLYVKAEDNAGNLTASAVTVAFGVDQSPPALTETAIGPTTKTESANFSLTGNVSDSNSLSSLTVSINGGATSPVIPAGDGSYTVSQTVDAVGHTNDGTNTYTLVATDVAGKTTTLARTVIIDTTPPTLTISNPAASAWLNGTTYTVRGVADDGTGTGVKKVYYLADNAAVDHSSDDYTTWNVATGTVSWSGSINLTTLAEGNKKLWVRSVDNANNPNASATTVLFGVDQNAPSLAETGIGAAAVYQTATFTFAGTAGDTNALTGLTVSVDSGAASSVTVTTGNWTYQQTVDTAGHTNDGIHTYLFTATDVSGRTTTLTRTETIDTTAPAISYSNVSTSSTVVLVDPSPKILGTTSDTNGVASMQTKIEFSSDNGATWPTLSQDWTALAGTGKSVSWNKDLSTAPFATDGLYRITLRSTDIVGNIVTDTPVQFRLDRANPAVSLTAPVANTAFNTSFAVTGTASSNNLSSVQYQIDNGSFTALTGPFVPGTPYTISFNVDPTALTEAGHTLTVQAISLGGHVGLQTLTFYEDKTAPSNTFTNISLGGSTVLQDASPNLIGTLSDSNGVNKGEIQIEGYNGASWVTAVAWIDLGATGNAKSFAWSQNVGPSGANLADGLYRVSIRGTDVTTPANIATTATTTFRIDRTAPAVSITAPSNGAVYNQNFSMNGTASDANLSALQAVIDGGAPAAITVTGTTTPWVYNVDQTALSEGSHSVTITATDYSGKTSSQTLNFSKDSTAPTITVNTLTTAVGYSSVVLQDTNPILSGTLADNIALTNWNYRIEKWTDAANLAGSTWTIGTNASVAKDWSGSPYAVSGSTQPWSVDLTAALGTLADGRYRILIHATDASLPVNTSADVIREFRVDRSSPALAITTPATQGLYFNANITVAGTATEANGISSVKLKFDSNDFSSGTIVTTSANIAGNWTTPVSISGVSSGPHILYAQATSYTNKTSLQSVSVNVDTQAPTITITSHQNGAIVTGRMTLSGTSGDNTLLQTVQYRYGFNASTWSAMPNSGLYSWSINFDTLNALVLTPGVAHQVDPNTLATSTTSGVYLLPVEIQATDVAGNAIQYATGSANNGGIFYVLVDPAMDLPVTSIFYPQDNTTLGGSVRIYGTATDNTWINNIQYAIDPTGTGTGYGAWTNASISGSLGPSVNWYTLINTAGELNPPLGQSTKTVLFKVHSIDSKDPAHTPLYTSTDQIIHITFNANVPSFNNMQILSNGVTTSYSSGVKAGGVFHIQGTVSTPVGLSDLKVQNTAPVSSTTSILGTAEVTPPTTKTIDTNPATLLNGRSYLIVSLGSTNFTLLGATANQIGLIFQYQGQTMPGGGGTVYESDVNGYFNYQVDHSVDSAQAGYFPNTSGIYSANLIATDLTNPNPYMTQSSILVQIDNYFPTAAQTSSTNIVGTQYKIQGTATDVGSGSGAISGIQKVVAYFERSGQILNMQTGGASTAASSLTAKDMSAGGTITSVAYAPTETGTRNYSASIDSFTENGVSDTVGSGGNGDGFLESLTLNGNTYNWWAQIDSTKLADGPANLHYVVFDSAGNATHYLQSVYVMNNPPVITKITVGTDLNGDTTVGNVASGESVDLTPAQFAASNFTVRNSMLNITVTATGGNTQNHYSIVYGSTELNQSAGRTGNSVTLTSTNFSGVPIPDTGTVNGASFTILVFDSTVGNNNNPTNQLQTSATLAMNVKNIDTVVPTVTMTNLYWNSTSDNSLYQNSAANGHIDFGPIGAGNLNDTNPKVSGTIKFVGTLSDDQRLQYITMKIGTGATGYNFGGGVGTSYVVAQWSGVSKTLVGVDQFAALGWKFVVTNEVLTSSGHTANWELDWDSSKLNTVAGTGISVQIQAQDFRNTGSQGAANLSTTASQTIDVVPYITSLKTWLSKAYSSNPSTFARTALGWYPVSDTETITINGFNFNGASTAVTVNGTSLAGIAAGTPSNKQITAPIGTTASSGDLVLTVNSVASTNNLHNTALSYNTESNNVNNLLLTDKRQLYIWHFTSLINGTKIRYPNMKIGPTGQVGLSYANNETDFDMYTNANANLSTAGTTTLYESSFTKYNYTAFAWDSNSMFYALALNSDIGGSGTGSYNNNTNLGFFSRTVPGSTNAYVQGNNKRFIESNYNGTTNDTLRSQFPDMVSVYNGTSTDIYMSYYDELADQVKFRWGNVAGNTTATANTITGNISNQTNSGNGSAANFLTVSDFATSTYKPGPYSTVGLTSTGVAVMAWYDATNRQLIFSYNTQPKLTTSGAQWQTNALVIDNDFAGWYVKMNIDAGNGIHMAYYNSSNGDLRYAYLTSYTDTSPKVSTVDSFLSTGTEISISTKLVGGNYVPYISYYMGSYLSTAYSVRMAYRTDFTTAPAVPDGATNDAYTQAWEVMTVPTSNNPKDYQVNMGFKDYNAKTAQPILGYANDVNFEAAQLK